ncbi:hypothetical protein COO91_04710 [Nostoc flagelliforme CCNUN1]|uniref:Uncharacterized protein n=1 Tax=Nostoc flagelliforme CCNUN1 TaxID=2038116 RepID=A0A2K8SVE6_9NOSO|nr:hypothetical protein COO91_04710 [Nostoc flagelliforme CCNUN1]
MEKGQRGKLFSLAPLNFPLLRAPLPLPHSPLPTPVQDAGKNNRR